MFWNIDKNWSVREFWRILIIFQWKFRKKKEAKNIFWIRVDRAGKKLLSARADGPGRAGPGFPNLGAQHAESERRKAWSEKFRILPNIWKNTTQYQTNRQKYQTNRQNVKNERDRSRISRPPHQFSSTILLIKLSGACSQRLINRIKKFFWYENELTGTHALFYLKN